MPIEGSDPLCSDARKEGYGSTSEARISMLEMGKRNPNVVVQMQFIRQDSIVTSFYVT
jgi:hypothetical protein